MKDYKYITKLEARKKQISPRSLSKDQPNISLPGIYKLTSYMIKVHHAYKFWHLLIKK